MKKSIALFSLLGGLSCMLFTALHFNSVAAYASDDVIEVTLGPGKLNPAITDPETIEKTPYDNYSVAYRGSEEDYWLMLFPSDANYDNLPFYYTFSDNEMRDTDLSLIQIYYNETSYFTAEEACANQASRKPSGNIFHDTCINFSIPISGYMGVVSAKDVYKVVISSGLVFPYAGSSTTKYVLSESKEYKNPNFGSKTCNEIIYKSGWEIQKTLSDKEDIRYVACASRDDNYETYRLHIRDSSDTTGFGEDDDGHNCYVVFLFPIGTYNETIDKYSNVSINKRFLDRYNIFEKIKFVTTTDETITLADVTRGKDDYQYNIWGEKASIGFKIGNKDCEPGVENYNGKSFSKIIIESGCEFPSFETTNGETTTVIKYVQSDPITLVYNGGTAYWSLQWKLSFDVGSTTVQSVSVDKSVETINNESTNFTYVNIKVDNHNFIGDKQYCTYYTDYLVRNIFVNGHSILTLNGKGNTHVFINAKEKGSISLSINDLEPNDVTEIIVKKGCQIMAYSSTGSCVDNYGKGAYYANSISVSYSRDDSGDFKLDDEIYWTIWYDGQHPVRVLNNDYYNTIEAPQGEDNEKGRFICWVDIDGNEVQGIIRVTSCIEFSGKYLQIHTVKIIVDDDVQTYSIDHNKRLTSTVEIKTPYKPGFIFDGWFDENNEEVNIDNLITRDIVITAKFSKDYNYKGNGGCSGNIVSFSAIATLVSVAGLCFVSKRKKEN